MILWIPATTRIIIVLEIYIILILKGLSHKIEKPVIGIA
jgi:hypothetical protein